MSSDAPVSPIASSSSTVIQPPSNIEPLPSLPNRTYLNPTTSFLPVAAPLPVYAPNSIVPKCIRIIAIVVFLVGGSCSAAVAWIYKTIIYPRLQLTLSALTQLHTGDLVSYSKLLGGICRVAVTPANRLISPKTALLAERIMNEEAAELASPSDEEIVAVPTIEKVEEDPSAEEEVPPSIFESLSTSLRSLATLVSSSASSPAQIVLNQPTWKNAAGATSGERDLAQSLYSMIEYVEAETFASASLAYRSYGVGAMPGATGTSGNEQKAVQEAVSNFKSEVRAIKGALLNRRNFSLPRPESTTALAG